MHAHPYCSIVTPRDHLLSRQASVSNKNEKYHKTMSSVYLFISICLYINMSLSIFIDFVCVHSALDLLFYLGTYR